MGKWRLGMKVGKKEMLLCDMLEAFAGPEPSTYSSSKHSLLKFQWPLYQMVILQMWI